MTCLVIVWLWSFCQKIKGLKSESNYKTFFSPQQAEAPTTSNIVKVLAFRGFWNGDKNKMARKSLFWIILKCDSFASQSKSRPLSVWGDGVRWLTFSGLSRNILIGLRFSVWLIHWRPLSCPCLKVDWHTGLRTWTSVKYRLIQQLCCSSFASFIFFSLLPLTFCLKFHHLKKKLLM